MAKVAINLATGALQQEELIVGIDLGTTNSLVAYVHPETRQPAAINDLGRGPIVPSVIHFPPDGGASVVGTEARELLILDPAHTIYSVKRLLGKSYRDLGEHAGQLGYRVIDDDSENLVKVRVGERFYSPIELSADILGELRHRAEHALKTPVRRAVITVPAYFNDSQRQATRDAGRLAGLEVLRIVNEPTAAALAYGIGLDPAEEKTVAVYDLGGGTFDISILRLHQGIFEVLSTHGDTWLGGDDMDRAVVEHWQTQFALPASFGAVAGLRQQLRLAAEMAKRYLSQHDDFTTQLEDEHAAVHAVTLTRAEFDGLIQPLVARTLASCRQAVQDAGSPPIDAVLLVGGSTRVPLVYNEVSKFFGQPANNSLNPDEVVALGAAIQADILAGNRRDVLLLDVTPLTLGIETLGGLMDAIIPRNSKIPTKAGRQYTTSVDGQVNLKISVFQGERDLVQENRKLGEFVLSGIPAMPAGLPKIDVNFFLNADGILRVEAVELRSDTRQQVEIKPQYGLTDQQVEQMLLDSLTNAKQDVAARLLIEARTAAEQLLYQVERFLTKNRALLADAEVSATTAQAHELRQALEGADRDAILKRMDELDELTRPFAERVMNHSIKQAMTGKQIG
ncbi:MAG: Fe-S protein assembly chaperone HscA [Janthinobacterium lividum]